MGYGGGPNPDAFTLGRVGRGRLFRGRHGTSLERRDGDTWLVVQRYSDLPAASHALDEVIAGGGSPADYRLVTPDNTGVQILVLIGSVILGVLVVFSFWQLAT